MLISFDLDDVLVCYRDGARCEPRLPWYLRLFVDDEPLRFGAPALIWALQARGWDVCIYTTSQRKRGTVYRWLKYHGVRVSSVINQQAYNKQPNLDWRMRSPSKNPVAYGIDLHVDDLEGVRQEGEQHGFNVVIVSPDDARWTEEVLLAAAEIEANKNR